MPLNICEFCENWFSKSQILFRKWKMFCRASPYLFRSG